MKFKQFNLKTIINLLKVRIKLTEGYKTFFKDKTEALPSCYEAGSYGFLCGEPIPNGFPNKNDPLFQAIDLKLNGKTPKQTGTTHNLWDIRYGP